ncbi:hypothetical protein NPIL_300091 [Nephila pilipes]|uniref:Uncharacterized protein n=1 Tax=Nephila pilipes TaxID=299642 RepID=A0A8X6PYD2_NEPPI|nr:hypothetical protein NPIL_300091 [Nephila pilipes]
MASLHISFMIATAFAVLLQFSVAKPQGVYLSSTQNNDDVGSQITNAGTEVGTDVSNAGYSVGNHVNVGADEIAAALGIGADDIISAIRNAADQSKTLLLIFVLAPKSKVTEF